MYTPANALEMNQYPEMRVVFFDAFGTLLHLPRSVGYHYREVALRHGLDIAVETLDSAFVKAWKSAPAPLLTRRPRPDDDRGWWQSLVNQVLDTCNAPQTIPREELFTELYHEFIQPGVWELYPEVLEVLEQVRASYPIGILSNFDGRLRVILEGLGIASLFDHWVISSEVGADKPEPYIFECALKLAGVAPAEALHVGDDPVGDWDAAAAAGFHVFRLDRPQHSLRDLLTVLPLPGSRMSA